MKINRKTSIAVMSVAIIAALLAGNKISLSKQYSALENTFVNGVENDGFGIQSDLDVIADNGNSILAIARRYDCSSDELTNLEQSLQNLKSANGISDKSAALEDFELDIEIFYHSFIDSTTLDDSDNKLIKMCYTEIESRILTIRSNGYNNEVAQYNKMRSTFPSNIIAPVIGVPAGEEF